MPCSPSHRTELSAARPDGTATGTYRMSAARP
jgi:hypothetical protein